MSPASPTYRPPEAREPERRLEDFEEAWQGSHPPALDAFVPRGGQAVDFNQDGYVDLLFGSRLLINDGDGTFSDGSAGADVPVRADQGLRLMDVDLDGDLDLIHHDGSVTRLYRNAAGVFDAGTIIAEDSTPTFGYGLAACDMNIDGFEDLYIANNDTGTGTGVPKLLVNVNGTLMPSAVQREFVADSDDLVDYNDLFSCADVSGDGRPDTVARWGDGYRLLRGAVPLSTRIRIRVLGAGGQRNQQGRLVRITPQDQPNRIMTRVVESGSGYQSQGEYDLVIGTSWTGDHDIEVLFPAGTVTATAEPGDDLTIYADGRVVAAGMLQPPIEPATTHGRPGSRNSIPGSSVWSVRLRGSRTFAWPASSEKYEPRFW